MKNKRSIFTRITLAMVLMLTLSISFTACSGKNNTGNNGDCTHQWTDATCTESKTCSLCNAKEGEALGHDFEDWAVTEAATCEEDGNRSRSCKRCQETETEKVDAMGHDKVQHPMKDASCTEDGNEAYETCSRCDYTTYKKIPKAHKYIATILPPTCTEPGYTTYECSVCHDKYTADDKLPTGHSLSEWFVFEKTTLTSDGTMRQTCMNCNLVENRTPEVISEGYFKKTVQDTPKEGIEYKLFETGTLRITGTGTTFDCGEDGSKQPFFEHRDKITNIIIGEGINVINNGSFAGLKNLTSVTFPTSLTEIGDYAFSNSYKAGIINLVIPETIEEIGVYAFGSDDGSTAVFTDIEIHNSNMSFSASNAANTFNGGKHNSEITIYGYGTTGKVYSFANTIGATYLNLNDIVKGTVENVSYYYFNGKLTLSAVNIDAEAVLTYSTPWLNSVDKTSIKEITIGNGIKTIPANYFKDYTALTSVTISDTLTSIESGAFATTSACNTRLSINFPEDITTLGEKIFENRTKVSVSAFDTPALEGFAEDGVTLDIFRSFKILLIGNSLSQDASDCQGSSGLPSQLYDIIKGMLGKNSFVEIGIIYGGARTASWHATKAEAGTASHTFLIISDETNGVWEYKGYETVKNALEYSDWDVVTIQPYATEATTGVGSMKDTDGVDGSKDEKFLPLSVSLPFLLDYIDSYAPTADVYYYMTWSADFKDSPTATPTYDTRAGEIEKRISVALDSMEYAGTNSGKKFAGIINGGTAIQNARRTYFALLDNKDTTKKDNNYGLQRDSVHLSYHVGRYIVGLTFAEILIPENKRADGYELPEIAESDIIGKLPKQYTEVAQFIAKETAKSVYATGKDQYMPVKITVYQIDPARALADDAKDMSFNEITAANTSALVKALESMIGEDAIDGMQITVTINGTPSISATASSFSATVTITFGYTTVTVDITGTVKNA